MLRGQCIRSRAGLYYDNQAEFVEPLHAIADSRTLNAALGSNGRAFFNRHYSWPVIEQKYLDMLERLRADERVRSKPDATMPGRQIEPGPGWFARRRRILPPADQVLAELPSGPVIDSDQSPADAGRHAPRLNVEAVS